MWVVIEVNVILILIYVDVSPQFSHTCTTNTDYYVCSGEDDDTFDIQPPMDTSSLKLELLELCYSGDEFRGLREVVIYREP